MAGLIDCECDSSCECCCICEGQDEAVLYLAQRRDLDRWRNAEEAMGANRQASCRPKPPAEIAWQRVQRRIDALSVPSEEKADLAWAVSNFGVDQWAAGCEAAREHGRC